MSAAPQDRTGVAAGTSAGNPRVTDRTPLLGPASVRSPQLAGALVELANQALLTAPPTSGVSPGGSAPGGGGGSPAASGGGGADPARVSVAFATVAADGGGFGGPVSITPDGATVAVSATNGTGRPLRTGDRVTYAYKMGTSDLVAVSAVMQMEAAVVGGAAVGFRNVIGAMGVYPSQAVLDTGNVFGGGINTVVGAHDYVYGAAYGVALPPGGAPTPRVLPTPSGRLLPWGATLWMSAQQLTNPATGTWAAAVPFGTPTAGGTDSGGDTPQYAVAADQMWSSNKAQSGTYLAFRLWHLAPGGTEFTDSLAVTGQEHMAWTNINNKAQYVQAVVGGGSHLYLYVTSTQPNYSGPSSFNLYHISTDAPTVATLIRTSATNEYLKPLGVTALGWLLSLTAPGFGAPQRALLSSATGPVAEVAVPAGFTAVGGVLSARGPLYLSGWAAPSFISRSDMATTQVGVVIKYDGGRWSLVWADTTNDTNPSLVSFIDVNDTTGTVHFVNERELNWNYRLGYHVSTALSLLP